MENENIGEAERKQQQEIDDLLRQVESDSKKTEKKNEYYRQELDRINREMEKRKTAGQVRNYNPYGRN